MKDDYVMPDDIIVTTREARELITRTGNPHMIWDGTGIRVIPAGWYRFHRRTAGWLLIMTKADLLDVDPGAAGYDPVFLATLLTDYALNLDPA